MSGGIRESDWKIFRELHTVWLNRYCERVNHELTKRLSTSRLSPHERYLEAYKFGHRKGKELGQAFNDFRRSTALWQIRIIHGLGVVTDEELARFSDTTRNFVVTDF